MAEVIIDYAQHGIRLAHLLRQLDDHCLKADYEQAHAVSLHVIAEARLLSLSIKAMQEKRDADELRRKK